MRRTNICICQKIASTTIQTKKCHAVAKEGCDRQKEYHPQIGKRHTQSPVLLVQITRPKYDCHKRIASQHLNMAGQQPQKQINQSSCNLVFHNVPPISLAEAIIKGLPCIICQRKSCLSFFYHLYVLFFAKNRLIIINQAQFILGNFFFVFIRLDILFLFLQFLLLVLLLAQFILLGLLRLHQGLILLV